MKILFAHNSKHLVKKGDKVKKGDYIGEIGNANGAWFSHLHLSVSEGLTESQLKSYIVGWSKEKVQQYYKNPKDLFSGEDLFDMPIDEGNAGYDWLQWIGNGYHPGVDYNGLGGGDSDYGYKFKSPVDGEVTFAGDWGKGWGLCLIIEETKMKEKYQKFYDEKEKSQGADTIADWVKLAYNYREEREEAKESAEHFENAYKKQTEEILSGKFCEEKIDDLEFEIQQLQKKNEDLFLEAQNQIAKHNKETTALTNAISGLKTYVEELEKFTPKTGSQFMDLDYNWERAKYHFKRVYELLKSKIIK